MNYWKDQMIRKLAGRRSRKRQVSRYAAPEKTSVIRPDLTPQLQKKASIFERGSASPIHAELPAHENAIKISISVPLKKADGVADNTALEAVISAGRHEDAYPNRVLQDGTQNYGAVEGVNVVVDYGRAGVGSMENFHQMIKDKGARFAGMRYRAIDLAGGNLSATQLIHKFHFTYLDEFGKHRYHELDPDLHYSNRQFDKELIEMNTSFGLNRDTVMELKIQPGINVLITLYLEEILNIDNLLSQRAIQNGELTLA